MKAKLDEGAYEKWSKRIQSISQRFKSLFSDIANDEFNRRYKMSEKLCLSWDNVLFDVSWIREDLLDPPKRALVKATGKESDNAPTSSRTTDETDLKWIFSEKFEFDVVNAQRESVTLEKRAQSTKLFDPFGKPRETEKTARH